LDVEGNHPSFGGVRAFLQGSLSGKGKKTDFRKEGSMKNQCKWSCLLCVEVRDAGRKNIASVFYPYHFEEDSYVFKEE
jgi:hypothetical protein